MLIYSGVKKTQANPGVAKFGIALEWGSRGLEFESRHSDHKTERVLLFRFYFFLPSHADSKKSAFADLQEAAGSLVQTKEKKTCSPFGIQVLVRVTGFEPAAS